MYISLLKELYDQANRLTNSYMEGEFESKTAEQLTTDNFSYINRDLVGAKQELVKYEALPEEIIFDTSARSYIYEFGGTKEVRAIELYPENKVHRVRERDVHIYVKKSSEGSWVELKNWKFNKDEKNGALKFILKKAVNASSVKVRSVWDDRNVENESIDDYSTFKGNANNLLRIWTLENTLTEEYSYDGNSNRVYLTENGNGFSYEYYKNTNGGNTAKVRYDGKWYYTYDSNGNRTSRAKALISGVADKNKEYWTYEWDLWNRLVKVVQYNAPDNGECVEVSYEYDALNHRIKRTSYDENNKEREVTKYAYGRNGALAYQEKTKDGSVTKRSFTYLNNEIIGFTDKLGEEESVYYTVTDIQGSITEVYDGSSKLVWKSGYTAFGELAGEVVDLIDFDGMYTGCDYDAETGLTYHWNRWRSEDGSAFISEDPIRDGMNWYGYAGQNPMVYVDRIGLFAYGADGQQHSTNTNQTATESAETPSAIPQNQSPNITGQGPTGVPDGISPNLTNDNLLGEESSKTEFSIGIKSALKKVKKYNKEIHFAAEIFDVDPNGIASVIFQEKYHGVFADGKNLLAYILDGGVNDKTPPNRSYGLAEMQLSLVAEIWGIDKNSSGVNKKAYTLVMNDKTSIALIAAYISINEKEIGKKLKGADAAGAHNMGSRAYKKVLTGEKSKTRIAKRSEQYQEAIRDALNGKIDTRKDVER